MKEIAIFQMHCIDDVNSSLFLMHCIDKDTVDNAKTYWGNNILNPTESSVLEEISSVKIENQIYVLNRRKHPIFGECLVITTAKV